MDKPAIAFVIDDDKIYTYIITKQINAVDFCKSLQVFHNGLEAINYLQQVLKSPELLPDVILLDLNMPVMDGWQFLDEFIKLKINKKIPIYVVSSSISQADHEKAGTYKEVSDFYVKPVSRQDLQKMMTLFRT